jgi:hypothetical protein
MHHRIIEKTVRKILADLQVSGREDVDAAGKFSRNVMAEFWDLFEKVSP